ncbi:AAA family ATPase [Clostridium sp. JN-1]|mgnify:CR=1 FL=1|uniref:AAA family ATPase n=1 Tax=Clostridium sp. JN-1 TaxID=2483110 RepID=UPI000F0B41FE|nr:AAA family ATPase [Clostridium sp. JN-1]
MNTELDPQKIIYDFKFDNISIRGEINDTPEYDEVYKKIKTALEIDKDGYNVYLIDDFSEYNLSKIMEFVHDNLKYKGKPEDICYVVCKDEKHPEVLFLPGGKGKTLKNMVEKIKNLYLDSTYEFYNNASVKEKEDILTSLDKRKTDLVNKLLKVSKDDGFIMKPTVSGFTFVPIKEDGDMMSEKEYDALDTEKREEILDKINNLKSSAHEILDELKEMELSEIDKIKIIMDKYYFDKTIDIKSSYTNEFNGSYKVIGYLNDMCNDIEESIKSIYSISYEDDRESIIKIIYKYVVNVLVDNSEVNEPPVIFEEDPSVSNLIGSIEYENKNGTYVTNAGLIKSGSFLKANGGCLIIRANSLLNNLNSYYYLKKTFLSGKVDLNYNRGYLELLSLSGLKPQSIKFNETVILIGNYKTYDLLYSYDEDFKKLFKIRAERRGILNLNEETKKCFIAKTYNTCKRNKLHTLTDEAIKELAKFLSRKAEDRNKLYMNSCELNNVLIIADNKVTRDNRESIERQDIMDTVYKHELIEEQVYEGYKENKLLIDVQGKVIGQVNGLSVIDTGYVTFGRPIRITCSCHKGDGNVIDVQREANLSGNIHSKAINILKGYLNSLIGGYEKIPVNFHLSFEQVYGKVDGDSASVAEVMAMISALSKVGINQNIAVTGSIDQLGQVQAIGGVNEKIEGFFDICKLVGDTNEKGVLIPKSNISSLVLKSDVETEIANGKFHIYTMSNLKDAVEVLMEEDYESVIRESKKELKKYLKKQGTVKD